MITTSIFFNDRTTRWTLFGIGRDPVGRLGVIVALFDPLFDQVATHWVVPILTAGKTE